MKKFFDKFQSLKSASLIGINNYFAKTTGEIANHVVNVNISVENAKKTDLQRLENCNDNDLKDISKSSGINYEVCKTAYSEMLESVRKNLSQNFSDHTNHSKGQTDAYINLTPAIRLHKETMEIHVFGQAISKVVLIKGEYKQVKSSDKTIAKNAIKKHLDLRADKFRDFIVGNIDKININGETLVIQ